MKKILFSLSLALMAISVQAQDVNIPDANFKAALIATNTIDINKDGIIQNSEALLVTSLNLDNKSITSLVGIEAFTALKVLRCSQNQITICDVSKNVVLDSLWCNGNSLLTSINVKGAIVLRYLTCINNPKLTKICVNPAQLANLVATWLKDAIAAWTTECSSAINNLIKEDNGSKVLIGVYNHLGQEVKTSEITEGGVFIYKYSDGSFKRIARF